MHKRPPLLFVADHNLLFDGRLGTQQVHNQVEARPMGPTEGRTEPQYRRMKAIAPRLHQDPL